jgi:hypothetical protein
MAAAAFYDLDGTLCQTNLVHAFAYNARDQQGIPRSISRMLSTVVSAIFLHLNTVRARGAMSLSLGAGRGWNSRLSSGREGSVLLGKH